MERTPEQEEEYLKLPSKYQKYYDFELSLDRELNHEQLYKMTALKMEIDKVTGADVNINDPGFLKKIITKASLYIAENAPKVWDKVKDSFNKAIDYLSELIIEGILWVTDMFWKIFVGPTYHNNI